MLASKELVLFLGNEVVRRGCPVYSPELFSFGFLLRVANSPAAGSATACRREPAGAGIAHPGTGIGGAEQPEEGRAPRRGRAASGLFWH